MSAYTQLHCFVVCSCVFLQFVLIKRVNCQIKQKRRINFLIFWLILFDRIKSSLIFCCWKVSSYKLWKLNSVLCDNTHMSEWNVIVQTLLFECVLKIDRGTEDVFNQTSRRLCQRAVHCIVLLHVVMGALNHMCEEYFSLTWTRLFWVFLHFDPIKIVSN